MSQSLAQFVENVSGTSHLRVEQDLGDGFVRLQTSEAERRQAIQDIRSTEDIVLELLRNSRDAHAHEVFVAVARESFTRTILVIDDGEGIPASKHQTIFEPRVTSKLDTSHIDKWGFHGRGMALYSISVNAKRAFVASSDQHLGAAILVETDLGSLGEKRDQSTFPSFILNQDGEVIVRGPKNIMRTAVEFALEARSECTVYVGSPVEISATLYNRALQTLSAVDRAFTKNREKMPLVKQLGIASDPSEFVAIASALGLSLSERSARRIMDGDVEPLSSVLDRVVITSSQLSSQANAPQAPNTKRRGTADYVHADRAKDLDSVRKAHPSISQDDKLRFQDAVLDSYRELADKYYLESDVPLSVSVSAGSMKISIPLLERD